MCKHLRDTAGEVETRLVLHAFSYISVDVGTGLGEAGNHVNYIFGDVLMGVQDGGGNPWVTEALDDDPVAADLSLGYLLTVLNTTFRAPLEHPHLAQTNS